MLFRSETYGDEPGSNLEFDTDNFDAYTVVPGYLEALNDSTKTNQRGGIWEVVINDDIVNLNFVRQILPGQTVKVVSETSNLIYNPALAPGKTVPEYTLLNDTLADSTQNTSFDSEGTRFVSNKDNYVEPGTLDKYIKFPKTGVF